MHTSDADQHSQLHIRAYIHWTWWAHWHRYRICIKSRLSSNTSTHKQLRIYTIHIHTRTHMCRCYEPYLNNHAEAIFWLDSYEKCWTLYIQLKIIGNIPTSHICLCSTKKSVPLLSEGIWLPSWNIFAHIRDELRWGHLVQKQREMYKCNC
jgi:hypothetical protein